VLIGAGLVAGVVVVLIAVAAFRRDARSLEGPRRRLERGEDRGAHTTAPTPIAAGWAPRRIKERSP
jgi:hypothetical protein